MRKFHAIPHFFAGIICGPFWESFAVGDHLRCCTAPLINPRFRSFTRQARNIRRNILFIVILPNMVYSNLSQSVTEFPHVSPIFYWWSPLDWYARAASFFGSCFTRRHDLDRQFFQCTYCSLKSSFLRTHCLFLKKYLCIHLESSV